MYNTVVKKYIWIEASPKINVYDMYAVGGVC